MSIPTLHPGARNILAPGTASQILKLDMLEKTLCFIKKKRLAGPSTRLFLAPGHRVPSYITA